MTTTTCPPLADRITKSLLGYGVIAGPIYVIAVAAQAAGLKVFAVNLNEDKQKVQDFIDKTKLSIPVLLSSDEKMATAYGVQGIPETVLVGKDGLVKKVIVGFDESDAMQKAVEAELKVK